MGGPARSEDAVPFLQSPLAEEEATDKKLMQLAQSRQAARKGRLGRPLRLNGMAGSNAIWAGLNRRR